MAAVAPVPKQFTKHSRPRHSDEPLSDSGGEEPRKIRSYIKPSAKPIFPIRQELHDTNSRNLDKFLPRQSTTAKNLHPTPTPTTSKSKYSETPAISVPAHTKSQRPSPSNAPPSNLNGKPGTTLRPGSTGTISRKSSEERRGGVDSHALAKEKPPVKRRDIPKPPPLPQKRPQGPSSTRLDRPQLTHQQEWKDSSPPAKKSREEARIPSPPVPVIAQGVEEEARSPTVDATPDEALKWNEHANLAYLFKRHMRIFTLATLPDEESWFLRVMEGSATDDKITTRRTKNDNAVAERSNIGCDSAKELTPKKSDTRSNVGCDSAKESTSKKSDTRSCEDVPLFMSNPVSREVPRNSSPDQCRMSSPFAPVCFHSFEANIQDTPYFDSSRLFPKFFSSQRRHVFSLRSINDLYRGI
ncbi:hypothetical protein Y032_0018g3598 [Ancylostoma ceylanicum]|uniref:Uncharacterized protein n=1 Tax=Ancylostoma ceylanicum TaxID=53326 RepID=A0A016V370_9BILA|nr:hypothetical protein Y032_0018g3598 [Ancylostoma ceylanicum]